MSYLHVRSWRDKDRVEIQINEKLIISVIRCLIKLRLTYTVSSVVWDICWCVPETQHWHKTILNPLHWSCQTPPHYSNAGHGPTYTFSFFLVDLGILLHVLYVIEMRSWIQSWINKQSYILAYQIVSYYYTTTQCTGRSHAAERGWRQRAWRTAFVLVKLWDPSSTDHSYSPTDG